MIPNISFVNIYTYKYLSVVREIDNTLFIYIYVFIYTQMLKLDINSIHTEVPLL